MSASQLVTLAKILGPSAAAVIVVWMFLGFMSVDIADLRTELVDSTADLRSELVRSVDGIKSAVLENRRRLEERLTWAVLEIKGTTNPPPTEDSIE